MVARLRHWIEPILSWWQGRVKDWWEVISATAIVDISSRGNHEHRSSIWLGENRGRSAHIYWELADLEIENDRMTGAPIYIAVDAGNVDEEVAIRLPKEIAIRLLMMLSPDWANEVGCVL